MDHLRLVWQTGETLLESVRFEEDPEATRYNILLSLQEMVTNVLRHAYELDDNKPIEICFSLTADTVEITLRDQGPDFNPLTYDTGGIDIDYGVPLASGGYGIYIAKIVMDEVSYERVDGWNNLRLRKFVGKGAAASR
jgi:serine/threonine-protein kinase RsbW